MKCGNLFLFRCVTLFCQSIINTNSFSIIGKESFTKRQDLESDNDINTASVLLSRKCNPCPSNISCVPQIQCPAHILMEHHEKPQICDLSEGMFGFCCVTGRNHSVYKRDKQRLSGFLRLSESIIEEARERYAVLMRPAVGTAVRRGHPDFLHNIVFHSSVQDEIENFQISSLAMEEVITSQILREKGYISKEEIETNNIDIDFGSNSLRQHCPPPPLCLRVNATYRTLDGTCNNPIPQRSMWGAAGQPMERLLPPAYEDGIWLARIRGIDGSVLTGARKISRILFVDTNRPHPKHNLLVMQFGQFLAHDITQSVSIHQENGKAIECCAPDGSGVLPPHQSHFACMAISIEQEDEFYSIFGQKCMNFVRLSLSPNSNCKVSYGRQRSKVTHFIDASPVYGSSLQVAKMLRTFHGGRLQMFDDFGRDLLPLTNEKEACGSNEPTNICFKSGDGRTNQIISLVAIHILFAREHNRVAQTLQQMNSQWTDEILYQEARRIVIAEFQYIVYNEYLPIVIGTSQMKRFRLSPKSSGFADGYTIDVNAGVTNEFTGAAFRFGHSTVDGKFRLQLNNEFDEIIDIPDVMFNPIRMRKQSFLDDIINAMLKYPMQQVDRSITHGLSRFLFRGGNPFGLDLAALNIQRGRDHALKSYNDYLEVIGRRRIRRFNQFPSDVSYKLERVYRHPDDIDLWVGGLLEPHILDGLVGLTFSEIIADQFSRLKHGDRYFYENGPQVNPGAFTFTQLNEIRKSSFARIICDNTDHLGIFEISRSAFLQTDYPDNEQLSCNSPKIPEVNLDAWKT